MSLGIIQLSLTHNFVPEASRTNAMIAVTNWDTKTCFESSTHESIRDEALFQPFIALSVPALLRMFITLNHF